ncbi:UDP-3-O-(3-hydroxymyristoyl)glucosamine N-acyltransferase [Pararhodobacter oceanensis]|uniref:UDP-3-O-(3-hydroxymyristoyl)glucosamine N-acyltransferase n=1 Tax=Pararhodobacter oceanensis TaxID=2172121 RepID=UPI003A8D5CB2
MAHSVSEIAAALGARFEGRGDIRVTASAEPAVAGPEQLALAMSPQYGEGVPQGQARAAVLWEGADWQALGLEAAIFATRPRLTLAVLSRLFDPGPGLTEGRHASAVIDPSAQIGADAVIGAFCVIGAGAVIGSGARLADHVTIGEDAVIGADALILSGVRIGARVKIGDRFIAQPNAVIGGDGFSFVTESTSRVELARSALGDPGETEPQPWLRIHSLGAVSIGDDVEVGANTTIDRGTVRDTRIGNGTKLDNLVMVGHNVVIGEDCLLCGQVGIAGSTRIGNRVVMGGQSGANDNTSIGDDAVIGGSALVISNVAAGRAMMGSPAVRMEQHVEIYKAQRRLPRMAKKLAELQKQVQELIEKIDASDTKP